MTLTEDDQNHVHGVVLIASSEQAKKDMLWSYANELYGECSTCVMRFFNELLMEAIKYEQTGRAAEENQVVAGRM